MTNYICIISKFEMENLKEITRSTIIVVEWANGEREAFGSIAAIYDHYTAEQVGCERQTIWNSSITSTRPKETKTGAKIYRLPFIRKSRK